MRYFKLYFTSILIVLAVSTAAIAQTSFGPPEKIVSGKLISSSKKLKPGDTFKLEFRGNVRKGYHIGANHKESL